MKFNEDMQAETLNDLISNTPGVVEHGIFYGLTDAVLIAANGVVSERWA
jgi:ribose 5-phosphate isomerase A